MGYYLALDAGGTSTRCWVADEERVLARETGPTVKLMHAGEELATERLEELVRRALGAAGVKGEEVTRAVMGLAGISSSRVRTWAERVCASLFGGELLLRGDEAIALDAAFQDGPGILIIAGTGSIAVGRCADGAMVTAGGWGPVIGDEGAGYWIGLEAIRTGLRAQDRGVDTGLLREIERFWNVPDLGALVAHANERSRPDFADLTEVVTRCAEAGDGLALSVLERAGEELAGLVSLVASKMSARGCVASDAAHVAFTGSVLGKIRPVRQAFTEVLAGRLPQAAVATEPVDPMEGALWRAREEKKEPRR